MITAGIDVGARTVKVVILKDGEIAAKAIATTDYEIQEAIENTYKGTLIEAGLSKSDVENIIATGTGAEEARFMTPNLTTEVAADAQGIFRLFPDVRMVIDVGAEEGRAVKVGAGGRVVDFVINEKCAAGSGTFFEVISRMLEMSLEDFGKASLESDREIPMNAHCTVFAEAEVVSLIHAGQEEKDISKAVHDAVADRIVSMVRRIGLETPVALIGGVSLNVGFVAALNRELETEIRVPPEPEYVGALGAALLAVE